MARAIPLYAWQEFWNTGKNTGEIMAARLPAHNPQAFTKKARSTLYFPFLVPFLP